MMMGGVVGSAVAVRVLPFTSRSEAETELRLVLFFPFRDAFAFGGRRVSSALFALRRGRFFFFFELLALAGADRVVVTGISQSSDA